MKRITLLVAVLAMFATAFADVITEQPAGILKNYNREGCCVVNDYEAGFYVAYQEGKVSIVFAEDGKVYMKNPLMAMAYDTWVEGTLSEDGTTITIPMGQVLYHSPYYDIDVILSWGSTSEATINWDTYELEVNYTPDESVEAAVFTIDGETIRLEGSAGADELTAEDLGEFAATGLSAPLPSLPFPPIPRSSAGAIMAIRPAITVLSSESIPLMLMATRWMSSRVRSPTVYSPTMTRSSPSMPRITIGTSTAKR